MRSATLIVLLFVSAFAFGSITPSFTCDVTKGCSPLLVNITDHSVGNPTTWYWDLGNGNTSTQRNPSATYLNPGNYTIKLIVSDGMHSDSVTRVVTVFQKPSVDFICDRTTACPNDSIHFTTIVTAGDAPISQYAWGFGNGIASSDKNAAYKYDQSGIYNVTLVVQDTNGCIATKTKPSYIHVWPSPTAAYTISPIVSCGISQTVTFTNQSQGTGLSYQWSFGDTSFSTQTSPTHFYTYGKYTSKLVVTNTNGCKSTLQQNLAVINLKADFVADKVLACAGEDISFANLSPMPGTSWAWSFGDGGTSIKASPKHTYTNPGIYSVTFVVKDAFCKDSITKVSYIRITQGFALSFTANQRNSCSTPFPVQFTSAATTPVHYSWDFGDGNSDTTANPLNIYTVPSAFSVTLTAIDSNGCTVILSAPGFINTSKPQVKFIADTLVCPGATVKFTNRTVDAVKYLWHFGDGDTSTVASPTHVYRTFGYFTVSLTAVDTSGCDSTLIKSAYIHVDSTKVNFRVDETFSHCPPLVSVFSSITNRNDLKFFWDFGDGYTDTAANPTHIFFHPGIFTVKLIGISKQGCTDTIIYPNMIEVQGPSGQFSLTPTNGCIPLVVNFTGSVSPNALTVACDLGDGRLYSDSVNFNYTYNAVRTYHPKFILTDRIGCSVPYDLDSITTHPTPVLHLQDTSICAGQSVKMSLGTDHYSWEAKVCDTCGRIPNIIDTVAVATLTPPVNTNYTVTASNWSGCSATGRFSINVAQLPVLLPYDTIKVCKNDTTLLRGIQADSVNWSPPMFLSCPFDKAPTCTAPSSMTYTVTAYNKLGCSVSEQIVVKVIDKVTVALTKDTTVCPGSSVQLNVAVKDSSVNGVNYTWSPASYLDNGRNPDPVAQLQSQTETFKVITRSGGCTPDTSSVIVHVAPAAHVKLPGTITTTPNSEVTLKPLSSNLTSCNWSATDSLTCADCRVTTLIPVNAQVVYLSGTNEYGCTAKDSMNVHIIQCDPASIFVPNTFTPNGDGLHDVLYLHSRTLAHLGYFRVFDRWGSMVYEGKDMAQGWDGTINGTPAEQGVYLFAVNGTCESGYDVENTGTVTLLR